VREFFYRADKDDPALRTSHDGGRRGKRRLNREIANGASIEWTELLNVACGLRNSREIGHARGQAFGDQANRARPKQGYDSVIV
jgi:hypothetical protein